MCLDTAHFIYICIPTVIHTCSTVSDDNFCKRLSCRNRASLLTCTPSFFLSSTNSPPFIPSSVTLSGRYIPRSTGPVKRLGIQDESPFHRNLPNQAINSVLDIPLIGRHATAKHSARRTEQPPISFFPD